MADHARKTLRDAVATIIGTTMVKYVRVYKSRLVAANLTQAWPSVAVYVDTESSNRMKIHPSNLYQRSVRIVTEGRLQVNIQTMEALEDRMEEIASEIETKLTAAALLASFPKLKDLMLTDTTMQIIRNEDTGEIGYAAITLGWQLIYMTAEGAPTSAV